MLWPTGRAGDDCPRRGERRAGESWRGGAQIAVDDAPWDLFMSLASTLSYEDVRQVAAPRAGTADEMIQQLTPAEREALARMIHAGIGDVE